MNVMRALWVGMFGAVIATPAIAAGGKIFFTGSIVVPADCRTDLQVQGRQPTATLDCGARAGAPERRPPAIPVAEVAVRPLHDGAVSPDGIRRYVVDVTYR